MRAARVGTVGGAGENCQITGASYLIQIAADKLATIYESALPRRMTEQAGLTS